MQEVWLYGVIEKGGDVSALDIRQQLAKFNKADPIVIRINSPGGVVTEAVAIRSQLAGWPGGVNVMIDGIAASAASYLSTIGKTVAMHRDALQMVHDAWGVTIGNAADHDRARETLDMVSDSLVAAYATKSGKSRAEIRAAMRRETWFTAAGAVDFGLADVIVGDDGNAVEMSGKQASRSIAALQRQLDDVVSRIAAKG